MGLLISALAIAAGIAFLYFGGDVLVDGATALARSLGISPLVVGLTVVSFATSAPELAATLTAAFQGAPDMALGNVIGSNIANVALILGLTATLAAVPASGAFIRRDVAFMIVATALIYPVLGGGAITRLEGAALLVALATFIGLLLYTTRGDVLGSGDAPIAMTRGRAILYVAGGVVMLVLGAQVLIYGAVDIARTFGVSERVIGLTLLAFGTSLPELAACIVAVRKGEADIVLGNVVGSNIFNLLCILGTTAVVHPIAVAPAARGLDFAVMAGTSVLLLVVLVLRRRVGRASGLLLLTTYVVYTIYLLRG
ncbi:MAG: calcium/sodium antiporter [Acidobacteriota bacterium]